MHLIRCGAAAPLSSSPLRRGKGEALYQSIVHLKTGQNKLFLGVRNYRSFRQSKDSSSVGVLSSAYILFLQITYLFREVPVELNKKYQ